MKTRLKWMGYLAIISREDMEETNERKGFFFFFLNRKKKKKKPSYQVEMSFPLGS